MVIGCLPRLELTIPHENVEAPRPALSVEDSYTNAVVRARHNHYTLSRQEFVADCLPLSTSDIGPGSLALFIGSEPGFSPETVWFKPSIHGVADPESLPPLKFDQDCRWWRITEAILREEAALARGKYLVGCPDLVENLDILAALRDPQNVLFDLIERPGWVQEKLLEINQVFFEAHSRVYDIIKLDDGSSAFGAFELWAPGKVAKVQCDAAAMISPEMFREFVVPPLVEQCKWLDYSMFHLDGTQCICHLDALLEIEDLDAIEWTPQSGIEQGGSPRWYSLYKRILEAGKSLQAIFVLPEEVIPLLDAVGGKGVYLLVAFRNQREVEAIMDKVEAYR